MNVRLVAAVVVIVCVDDPLNGKEVEAVTARPGCNIIVKVAFNF